MRILCASSSNVLGTYELNKWWLLLPCLLKTSLYIKKDHSSRTSGLLVRGGGGREGIFECRSPNT